jgi:hypothetical protein
MRSQRALRAAILFAAGIVSTASWADDLRPPSWRGLPRTTLAEWEFLTPLSPTAPDGTILPVVGNGGGGGPLATIQGPMFHDNTFDPDGVWIGVGAPTDPPGQIVLDIPNWIDTEPLKLIQIQMTVQQFELPNPDGSTQIVTPFVESIDASDMQAGPVIGMRISVNTIDLMLNNLFHRTELWRIRPNPDYERIVINVPTDTLVDQIVVDTISFVPEPGTIVLGLISAMGISFLAGRWRNCKN